jgi:hypothetical protein
MAVWQAVQAHLAAGHSATALLQQLGWHLQQEEEQLCWLVL